MRYAPTVLGIGLRPVDDTADAAFLLAVYASTRAAEMAMVPWTDRQKGDFVAMQHRAQTEDFGARYPEADHQVIELLGLPIGRLWVDRRSDEIRVLDLTLLPEHQGAGIGSALMGDLQHEAREVGRPLRLSVAKDNRSALRLYQRLGFVTVGDLPTHHLMEWTDEPPSSRVGSAAP